MTNIYYSWIPNLSSRINFQYITDEIDFDNSKIQVEQVNCDDCGKNKKKFSLSLNSSDQFSPKNRGYDYKVMVTLERQKDKSILGHYEESLPDTVKISESKRKYLDTSFVIEEDGFITIEKINWNVSSNTTPDGYEHKRIGIYSNIKYILHKDVHHDPKEDIELGLYSNKDEYKYSILDKFILSIKAFERQIKDDTDPISKLDFYEKKFLQASGYNAYLKTYTAILRRNNLNGKEEAKVAETLLLADNIIESSKYLIEQYKNKKKETESFMLVILAIMTLFLPSLIASLNLTDPVAKHLFDKTEEPFIMAAIYTLFAMSAGYYYTFRKASSILYYKFARTHKNIFMALRNEFTNKFSLINILILIVIILLIGIGVLITMYAMLPFSQ